MGWYDQVVVQRPDVGSAKDLITGAGQVTQSLQNAVTPLMDIASNQRIATGNQMARDAVSKLTMPDLVNGSLNDVMAYKNAVNNAMAYGDKDTQALLGKTASDYENAWGQQQQQIYQNKSLAQAAELAKARNAVDLQISNINAAAQRYVADQNNEAQHYTVDKNYSSQMARIAFEQAKAKQEIKDKMTQQYLDTSKQLHDPDFLNAVRRANDNGFWKAPVSDRDVSKVGNSVQALLNAEVITPAYAAQLLTNMANPGGYRATLDAISKYGIAPKVDQFGNLIYQTDKDGNILKDKNGNPMTVNVDLRKVNPMFNQYYDPHLNWGPLLSIFNASGIREKEDE